MGGMNDADQDQEPFEGSPNARHQPAMAFMGFCTTYFRQARDKKVIQSPSNILAIVLSILMT